MSSRIVKSMKVETLPQILRRWLPEEGVGVVETGEGSQKVETSSYKISKSGKYNVKHGNYS